LMAVVVLPTPPFWLEMQMIRPTLDHPQLAPRSPGRLIVQLARGLDTDQIHDRSGSPARLARLLGDRTDMAGGGRGAGWRG
jgi:hypothetical protein